MSILIPPPKRRINNVMTTKHKDSYLQIRIREDVKEDLQITAEARGLTMSALINLLIAQVIRDEQAAYPHLFNKRKTGIPMAKITVSTPDKLRKAR